VAGSLPSELIPLRLTTSHETSARYADLTADHNPIHFDAAFAASTPFGAPIAHGTQSLGLLMLCIEKSVGVEWTVTELQIRFVKPVKVGETVVAGGELADETHRVYHVFVDTEAGQRAIEGTLRLSPNTPT
jgi:3-hydroxybutyryl-CoA dehydratase